MITEFAAADVLDARSEFERQRRTGNLFPRQGCPMALMFEAGVARYVEIDIAGMEIPEDGRAGDTLLSRLAAEQHSGDVVAVF